MKTITMMENRYGRLNRKQWNHGRGLRAQILFCGGPAMMCVLGLLISGVVCNASPTKHTITSADCAGCHDAKWLAPDNPPIVSQRAWQSENGDRLGAWNKGDSLPGAGPRRAVHGANQLDRCFDCHKPLDISAEPGVQVHCTWCHSDAKPRHTWQADSPTYPPGVDPKVPGKNCASECHRWTPNGATIAQTGFLNISGNPEQTTYRGPISAGDLLGIATTEHSTNIFATHGCAGLCHGGPTAKHGTITLCTECHDLGVMHATHIPFLSAEQPLADPKHFTPTRPDSTTRFLVCDYCHGVPSRKASWVGKASCWNCHLTGHKPIVPYWNMPSGIVNTQKKAYPIEWNLPTDSTFTFSTSNSNQ